MKEGSAQQVLYNSALTLMTFTLTTWNLDVYNELELRPTLHILFSETHIYTAQCAVCKVYFSAHPNNLKLILNFQKYYPIEYIFVPACLSARKEHFVKF